MPARPIADDLFTWAEDNPALIGGCCQDCGAYTFPRRDGCPRCGATNVAACELSRTGTLWTWTSQGFLPKAPFSGTFMSDPFEPWYVGLIELPGQLRVESILVGCTQDTLRIGMPMRLVTLPFSSDGAGDETVTFAFAPLETGAADTPAAEQSEETIRA
jgi:uncharacterized OB-fold protein